jgi:hypothetical protein
VSKVTVARSLGVDGLLESEDLDEVSGLEVEVLEDDLGEVRVGVAVLGGSVRVDVYKTQSARCHCKMEE